MKKGFIQRHLPRVIFPEFQAVAYFEAKTKPTQIDFNEKCNQSLMLYKKYSPKDWPVQF